MEKSFIISLLRRHGISLSRQLGQHLLVDEAVLADIAAAAGGDALARIVEIGAGAGSLSLRLAETGAQVIALELDRRFEPIHHAIMRSQPRLAARIEWRYADALDTDWVAEAAAAQTAGKRFVITGNIPYQITSPLVMAVLESGAEFESMVLMMQREVAERLTARPGSKRNGGITIKCQYFCDIETVRDVSRRAFLPPPEVESRVLRFRRRPGVPPGRPADLFSLVEAGFGQRRKMLTNSVAASGIGWTKPEVESALRRLGMDPAVRAEGLGLAEFMALLHALRGLPPAHGAATGRV